MFSDTISTNIACISICLIINQTFNLMNSNKGELFDHISVEFQNLQWSPIQYKFSIKV
jgi:hypothetical protein